MHAPPAVYLPMSSAQFHGYLEKRSVGRSLFPVGHNWRRRYIVLFATEIRWYEKADTNKTTGNVNIKGKRLGSIAIGPSTELVEGLGSRP